MKILFVCAQNVGRSQMAAALYNSLSADGHADSAGTKVGDEAGQTLVNRAETSLGARSMLQVMHEIGLDLSKHTRKQVHQGQLARYDKIIVMAEPENTPDWLRKSEKFTYWPVPDPRFMDADDVRQTRDDIKRRVVDLLQS